MIRNPFRDLDHKKLRRSSDVLQTQNDYYKIVNRRILIFSIIFNNNDTFGLYTSA